MRFRQSGPSAPFVLALGMHFTVSPTAGATQAPPQAHEFELTWQAPVGCPQRPAIIAAFIAKRHPDLPALPQASRGEIVAEDAVYVLRLTWRGVWGLEQRETRSEDCHLLGQLAALTLAVQARELQVSQRKQSQPGPGSPWSTPASPRGPHPPPPANSAIPRPPQAGIAREPTTWPPTQPDRRPSEPAQASSPPRTPEPIPLPSDPPQLTLGLAALGSLGVLPSASLSPQVDLSLHGHRWETQFALAYGPPSSFQLSQDARRAALDLWQARVSLCARPGNGRLSLPNCVGVNAGAMSLRRSEAPNPRPNLPPQFWLAVEIASGLRLRIHSHLSLEFSAAVLANLSRPAYTTVQRQPDPVFAVPLIGGRAFLGLRIHLPKTRPRNGGFRGRPDAGRIGSV